MAFFCFLHPYATFGFLARHTIWNSNNVHYKNIQPGLACMRRVVSWTVQNQSG